MIRSIGSVEKKIVLVVVDLAGLFTKSKVIYSLSSKNPIQAYELLFFILFVRSRSRNEWKPKYLRESKVKMFRERDDTKCKRR